MLCSPVSLCPDGALRASSSRQSKTSAHHPLWGLGPTFSAPSPGAEATPRHLVSPSSALALAPRQGPVCFGKVPRLLSGKAFSSRQAESEVVSQVLS